MESRRHRPSVSQGVRPARRVPRQAERRQSLRSGRVHGQGSCTTTEEVGPRTFDLAGGRTREYEAKPTRFNQSVDFVEQRRQFLDLVDDDGLRFGCVGQGPLPGLARSSFWQSRCLFYHKNGNGDAGNTGRLVRSLFLEQPLFDDQDVARAKHDVRGTTLADVGHGVVLALHRALGFAP